VLFATPPQTTQSHAYEAGRLAREIRDRVRAALPLPPLVDPFGWPHDLL
jgi:hypothetical protein